MEVPQSAELSKKIEDTASGDAPTPNKQKSEESEVQTVKKSKDEKGKKKDDKSIEQVLKALNSLGTNEEKLAALCKKYSEIFDENKKVNTQIKQFEKKCIALQREKDQLQTEQSKAILVRNRLENLCRELQKQNKAIKEEGLSKIQEEEEKRKVVSNKFQTALGEITSLMQQNNENFSNLKEENLEIQNKFKTLCEQYELKEQQVEKLSKQMQLESQLADVKLAKVKIDMFAEKEMLTNEKERLLVELAAYQNKCEKMQRTEAELRTQIAVYTEKYDEFQSALSKSHQIYAGFRAEIEKMSKKISRLEKETSIWKMKWEGSHKALLQMATEKQQRDAEFALTTRRLNQLKKLCRTLQSERTALIAQLKNGGKSPKVEDNESASIDLTTVDINDESQDQNLEANSNSILNKKLEKDDVSNNKTLSNTIVESNDNKNEEKAEKEAKLQSAENHLEAPAENCSIIQKYMEHDEILQGLLMQNQCPDEKTESKETENHNAALKSSNNDKSKKEQNSTKLPGNNESKKGKDGSKRKKK